MEQPLRNNAVQRAAQPPVEITVVKGGVRVGGVSLRYLAKLSNKYPDTTTVTEFVQQEIKPRTVAKKEGYLDMLARENPSTVRPTAQYFVSYVWAYPLKEVVDALVNTLLTEEDEKDVFVWMDAFCVNQHQVDGKKATPEQLQETFGESLKAIGKMAMVLINWKNPSYAKRIWCVFEAYMSKISGIEVVLAMSPKEEESLVDAMIRNEMDSTFLNTLFGSVNVEKATATIPDDQRAILSLIRTFGVAEVNAVVLGKLKQWLVLGGELAFNALDPGYLEAGNVCMARYSVHKALGEFDAALEWVDKALAIHVNVIGPEHSYTAACLNNRAACLRSLGRFEEALPVYEQAINIWTKTLGPNHPDVATCLNNKALCFSSLGLFEEAFPLYDQALAIDMKVYGPNHPDIAIDLNNTAECLRDLGRYEEALPLYDQCLAIDMKNYGPDHPDVAGGRSCKAMCLIQLERASEALPLTEQAVTVFRRVFGENHLRFAVALGRSGLALNRMGDVKEGSLRIARALEILDRVQGSEHPDSMKWRKEWQ